MWRKFSTLGVVTWVLVGVIVAIGHSFFDKTDTLSQVGSAILAILVWPFVVTHTHIGI